EVKNSKIRAEEYFEAFVTIGGREEDFIPIEVEFDYEIKSSNDKYVSFLITKFETLASAYQEQYFYNIDLENGRILTLKDCFGPDYKNIVTHEVNKGISNLDKDMNFYLFKDVDIKDLITTDSAFYINEDNEIIVVFNKYEIAAGAAGMFEFPVGKIS
ncbi:MAG: RsiV family protein, partial [Acutalibacteraceae bacterium]